MVSVRSRRSLHLLAATLIAAIAPLLPTKARTPEAPLTIIVGDARRTFRLGEDIRVPVRFLNTSHRTFAIVAAAGGHAEIGSRVMARDISGGDVARTEYGRLVAGESHDRAGGAWLFLNVRPWRLAPGQALSSDVVVNRMFVLTRPGRYVVRLAHRLPPEVADGEALSNAFAIEITK